MASYRIKYSITGQAKYVSHLDMAQVFERSMRRAQLPMAFSEGFNPHPKFSFGSALAVGVSSTGEYLEFELKERLEPEAIKARLNEALPEGFEILDIREVQEKGKTLMAILNRAVYEAIIPFDIYRINPEDLSRAIQQLLCKEEIKIMRQTKKGVKEKNIRPGIFQISGDIANNNISLRMQLATGSELNIRPEEVVQLILTELKLAIPIKYVDIHREGLYVAKDNDKFTSPFEG
ncbi:MAG: TIGR03936 family radical SAM-associated protein [Bacillota bacterium]|nr:TIGR03936 family radical SAM-associated protein [Bacillota bacterium]